MNKQDKLLKATIEEFFLDILNHFYTDFVPKIDLTKGFNFLDKDLPKFIPEATEIDRKADKVVQITLKDGTHQWLIIHIEVQGYKDNNFAHRMFVYYYRLAERFSVPIVSLVIYSDDNKQNRLDKYEVSCLNTKLTYEFDTYVIADHSIEYYEKLDNPIGIIFQVALMGMKRNLKDEELFEMKQQLFRKMLEKGYPKKQIKQLTTLIKEYVGFRKPEYNRKFDKHVEQFSKNKGSMGITETVIEIRTEEAKEKALKEGLEQGLEMRDLINELENKLEDIVTSFSIGLPIESIAKLKKLEVSIIKEYQDLIELGLLN